MTKPVITTDEQARCLRMLESAAVPMTAVDLAVRLNLSGSRETQRRRVRAIIEQLRESGCHVVATLQQGYWLSSDEELWRDYLEGRQIDAKRILAETHRRKKESARRRQGVLFDMRVPAGCARIGVC